MLKRILLTFIFCFATVQSLWAADPFIIEEIRVEGLQRVQPGAVLVAVPVKRGDEWNDSLSDHTIELIYRTGFFDFVELRRDGNDLVIRVTERPTIVDVNFDGNKKLTDEQIELSLASSGVRTGGIYSSTVTNELIEELKRAYGQVGYFAADVRVTVEPLDQNRVNVNFDIFEGDVALIKEIIIIGNEMVETEDILDVMKLSTSKTLFVLNRRNRYDRQQLSADLEAITSHYFDMGYIDFEIVSARTFITEERDGLLITITLTEGEQYRFADVSVESTSDIVPQEELDELIVETPGELYTFSQTNETRSNLSDEYTNIGYARAEVDSIPTINDEERTVSVRYVVDPGKLTYVRKITFAGNVVTADEVLRREMRILEGGEYSAEKIIQSRARLGRLGLFNNVDIRVESVPGTEDRVDLVVTVDERLTGSLLFGVGYSESEKAQVNLSVSQRNLFGTGKQVSLNTKYSEISQEIALDYTNPYYTIDGVSRGFSLRYTRDDTSETDSTSIYDLGVTGIGVHYGFPISEESTAGISFSAETYDLTIDEILQTDFQIRSFVQEHDGPTAGLLGLRYEIDSRDRALFATEGHRLRLSSEVSAGDLNYFILRGNYTHYLPIGESMTLRLSGGADYGDDSMPFFRNFFMVGSSTVRGFDSSTLGPRELCRAMDQATGSLVYGPCITNRVVGGNLRVLGRAELYLPLFGTQESNDKRISAFVDSGNTFRSSNDEFQAIGETVGAYERFSGSNLRTSAGMAFEWLSPIGPFSISYALPVRQQDGDETNRFQITLGYLN